ncbi:MAG: glycosyltransferase [Armatimonadota bacterium]
MIKVAEIELSRPIRAIDARGYEWTRALVRRHGVPVGWLHLPGGFVPAEAVRHALLSQYLPEFFMPPPRKKAHRPLISVVVCTRNRPESLANTLASIRAVRYARREVIVIDNASETARPVAEEFGARWVHEPRPGLDWARNRGIAESMGEIVAFIDDDALADKGWLNTIADAFADPEVACVTGLVVPSELETEAQELFECAYGGFGRGFQRLTHRHATQWPCVGTGTNMAFRRTAFDVVGEFDPAFDVGTPAGGAGDLEMFDRLLYAGCRIDYRPDALVYHTHRRSMEELKKQLRDYGKSFVALKTKCALRSPLKVARYMFTWYGSWQARRVWRRLRGREAMPMRLILAEIAGSLAGPLVYLRSARRARRVERAHIDEPTGQASLVTKIEWPDVPDFHLPPGHTGLVALVTVNGSPVGDVWVRTHARTIEKEPLAEAIRANLHLARPKVRPRAGTPKVSVVVPTCGRPELARCLESIANDPYPEKEIIVVDNVGGVEVPEGCALVREPKKGASFARNAGIRAATGEVIAFTDDDCMVEPGWVSAIAAAFEDPGVACVTGLIMPMKLETAAQEAFEHYGDGGMRRGYERRVYDRTNFPLLAAGRIGIAGNIAFRASVLAQGAFDEALCPGTPARCGEEGDLIYRLLRRGWKVRHEPRAIVRHEHRRSMAGLEDQLVAYSTGVYALLTKYLLEYREFQAVGIGLSWFAHRHLSGLPGTWRELRAALAGPLSYFASKRYVSKLRAEQGTERRKKRIGGWIAFRSNTDA